jgi:uncharacterized protein (DUF934 family)
MSAEATVLVTEAGFRPGAADEVFVPVAEAGVGASRLEIPADGDPEAAVPHFAGAEVIRIPFRSFSDGRGFTLARELRRLGYRGRIRASGHLISDQWPLARACGIDEVEITGAQAERQPEAAWTASRRPFRYLDGLR